jgi:hypothetical protein
VSTDNTDPANYWPGKDDHWPVSIGEDIPALTSAVLAVAAELRTANHLAFLTAQQTFHLSPETLAPIRHRLGFLQ